MKKLRKDKFARAALMGILANGYQPYMSENVDQIVKKAYEIADAMETQRNLH